MIKLFFSFTFFFISFNILSQQVAVLKYNGGGDWYANPTALPNLIEYSNQYSNTKIDKNPQTVTSQDEDLFNFPIIFMTGHGNVFFSDEDIVNLKSYLVSGGFLHISDNYGLDKYIRREMKKVFPKLDFLEIPVEHPIYHQRFSFNKGLPKIHEHDKKPPKGLGLFYEGRLIVFYDYECDLSDGWEDTSVHSNPKNVREKALQMGSNIIQYAFKN
ncbi:DUF4159 domain-containing protein [Tenacibaculum sp.]|nr:DUF4159 domain-containing protein [Tenacibaculum sp.]